MTILELRDVSVRSRENDDLILDGVSFEIEEDEKILIRGPSGSGKTTLFHVILGGVPVDSGEILFRNEPITEQNIREIRTTIAAVAQEPVLGGGTVREGILLPFGFRDHSGRRPSDEQVTMVLRDLGLDSEILAQSVSDLSGGEKQRVAIARALLLKSKIFLLDEVTSALDEENRDRIIDLLSAPGYTVLSISHDRSWASSFDRIWKLEKGRLHKESESIR